MATFTLHDETTAPDGARNFITGVNKKLGFVPSLYAVFAENPAVLDAYNALGDFMGKSGLSPLEQQIVLITTSVENECHFCVAAHSAVSQGQGLDMEVIAALRDDRALDDARLEALRKFTKTVVVDRGFVTDCHVDAFIAAGWSQADVLAVILGVAMKVISNYTNHVAETPLNEAFQAHAWAPKSTRAEAVS